MRLFKAGKIYRMASMVFWNCIVMMISVIAAVF